MKKNHYGAEVVIFPSPSKKGGKEISGPITMDAEMFKANLRAAFLSGFELAKERAWKIADAGCETNTVPKAIRAMAVPEKMP